MYEEYKKILNELELLEGKKALLREQILKDMIDSDTKVKEVDNITFSKCIKTVWKYTGEVDRLSDKVKTRQLVEQKKGIAKCTTSEYLLVKTKKDEPNLSNSI